MRKKNQTKTKAYEANKEKARLRMNEMTLAGQEIAPLPPVIKPHRRIKGEKSFKFFCETYFPLLFFLGWSEDHLRVLKKIERVVLKNDSFAVAMPRGNGKTTLSLCAVVWAILTGRHQFVYLISSTDDEGKKLLGNLMSLMVKNKLLLEDFPEAIYPLVRLEGETRKCKGQRYYGKPTEMRMSTTEIVMPTIPYSASSGAIIRVSGLTGSFRGAIHVRNDGTSVRPSLAICDDPQTDQSAKSLVQTAERLRLINGTIPGLAGPGKRLAIIVPCTVIQVGDLSDQILNRTKYPAWRGERTKLVYKMPVNNELWNEYEKIRKASIRSDGDGEEATAFYRMNRKDMDKGSEVAWENRFLDNEISAIQHAMNIKSDHGDETFASEYQNDPLLPADMLGALTHEQVCHKANGREMSIVPPSAMKLVAFVDVHDSILYYTIMAFDDDFTGSVIEYGTHPRQPRKYFTMSNSKHTLLVRHPGVGVDAAIQMGLSEINSELMNRTFKRGQGVIRIDRILNDIGYKPEIVAGVKLKLGGSTMQLSKGVGIKAGNKPLSTYKRKPGWSFGHHWFVPNVRGTNEFPHVSMDVNYWKTFLHQGLREIAGSAGCITIFGESNDHDLFAEHIANSEHSTLTHGHGRDVREWKLTPAKHDNHWLDCCVGCCVAASMLGAKRPGHGEGIKRKKKKIKLSEMQRKRHTHG